MSPSRRNYPLLLLSQWLSALGDNAILAVIVGQLTYLQKAGALSEAQLRTHNTVYTSLLFIPFILLAPGQTGGLRVPVWPGATPSSFSARWSAP